jgi:hypothetical protein
MKDIMIIGSVMTTEAAINPPQFTDAYSRNEKIATGRVCVFLPARTNANIKLFHEKIKDSMVDAMIPGADNGITILINAYCVVLPSTFADSSSDLGNASKYGIMTQMMRGKVTRRWVRINEIWVSVILSDANTINQGTRNVSPGMILVTKMTILALCNLYRAILYAAGNPINWARSVENTAIMREFIKGLIML